MRSSAHFFWIKSQLMKYFEQEDSESYARQILDLFYVKREKSFEDSSTEFNEADQAFLGSVIEKIVGGYPLAYIFNCAFFYGLDLYVDQNVLIPRYDSEPMVESVLEAIKQNPNLKIFADFGCGSGALGLALLSQKNFLTAVFIDSSLPALNIAKKNAANLNLSHRSCFVQADLCDPQVHTSFKQYDFIIANPPYISFNDSDLDDSVKKHEPALALFSDQGGYAHLQAWSLVAKQSLRPGGYFFCEFGYKQKDKVLNIFEDGGWSSDILVGKDLAGRDRFIRVQKKEE